MDDLIWLKRDRAINRNQQIIGDPLFRVEFRVIPSWNEFLAATNYPRAAQGMVKTWRKKGYDQAIWHAERAGWTVEETVEHGFSERGKAIKTVTRKIVTPVYMQDVHIILHFWRPSWRVYDVFSPFAKPIIDGFVDAGVLFKDDCEHVPSCKIEFMGVDPSLKLSPEAMEARKVKKLGRKKIDPLPARYWFDFYS